MDDPVEWNLRYHSTRTCIAGLITALEGLQPRVALLDNLAPGVQRDYIYSVFKGYNLVPPPEACAWWEWANGSTDQPTNYGTPKTFLIDPWFVMSIEQAATELEQINEIYAGIPELEPIPGFFPVLHYDASPILGFSNDPSGGLTHHDFWGVPTAWPALPTLLDDFAEMIVCGGVNTLDLDGLSFASIDWDVLPSHYRETYYC
jgi:hypothetical protein